MSFSLKSKFFSNARGLTFEDANGVAWSFNANNNQITISVPGAAGGTVTSVGLSDGSTTPIYTVTNSPVSVSGTLTYTLKTQSANLVFAGPTIGSAAQPTFRALVAADIQTLSPTWSGTHTFSNAITVNGGGSSIKGGLTVAAPASGTALTVDGLTSNVTTAFSSTGAANPLSVGWNVGISSNAWNVYAQGTDPLTIGTTGAAALLLVTGDNIRLTVASGGAITAAGQFAINGGTPTAALSGFGSPSGSVTSGLTSSATLAQTAGTLAALLAYLKTIGFIAT